MLKMKGRAGKTRPYYYNAPWRKRKTRRRKFRLERSRRTKRLQNDATSSTRFEADFFFGGEFFRDGTDRPAKG